MPFITWIQRFLFSKSTLINQKLCKRIYHTSSWQERVKEIINRPGHFSNPADEIRDLVKQKKVSGLSTEN